MLEQWIPQSQHISKPGNIQRTQEVSSIQVLTWQQVSRIAPIEFGRNWSENMRKNDWDQIIICLSPRSKKAKTCVGSNHFEWSRDPSRKIPQFACKSWEKIKRIVRVLGSPFRKHLADADVNMKRFKTVSTKEKEDQEKAMWRLLESELEIRDSSIGSALSNWMRTGQSYEDWKTLLKNSKIIWSSFWYRRIVVRWYRCY